MTERSVELFDPGIGVREGLVERIADVVDDGSGQQLWPEFNHDHREGLVEQEIVEAGIDLLTLGQIRL